MVDIKDDLNKNPELVKELHGYYSRFLSWCAKERILYQADIFDEVKTFKEKFIIQRLYNVDVKLWKHISAEVFLRDKFICNYCGKTGGLLEVDHINPISLGGTNEIVNLVTACRKCNRQKKNKTVKEFKEWRGRK